MFNFKFWKRKNNNEINLKSYLYNPPAILAPHFGPAWQTPMFLEINNQVIRVDQIYEINPDEKLPCYNIEFLSFGERTTIKITSKQYKRLSIGLGGWQILFSLNPRKAPEFDINSLNELQSNLRGNHNG